MIVTGTSADLLRQLDTTRDGLSTEEAERRFATHGANAPPRNHTRAAFRDLIRAAANPLNIILLLAAIASTSLGAATDAAIIGTMVLLSTALNYWQIFRSERAMRALQSKLAPMATARRDGQWLEIERRRLVTGDVIHLSAGDLVPADARLLQTSDLHVQQSALTGESMPAEKRACPDMLACGGPRSESLVFLGTSVLSGTATAVVFATGSDTGFGTIVEKLAERPEETDFERGMRRFSMLILRTVLFFVLFVLIVNIALGRDAFQSIRSRSDPLSAVAYERAKREC